MTLALALALALALTLTLTLTEVGDLDLARAVEQDVARLDVTVHLDAGWVRQRGRQLGGRVVGGSVLGGMVLGRQAGRQVVGGRGRRAPGAYPRADS